MMLAHVTARQFRVLAFHIVVLDEIAHNLFARTQMTIKTVAKTC